MSLSTPASQLSNRKTTEQRTSQSKAHKTTKFTSNIMSSFEYYNQTIQANRTNLFEIEEKDITYRSLRHYENQIRIMKGAIKLITIQHHRQIKNEPLERFENLLEQIEVVSTVLSYITDFIITRFSQL